MTSPSDPRTPHTTAGGRDTHPAGQDRPRRRWRTILVVLGVLIAGITGLLALYKFEEKWIKYRTTAESLKHEKFRYLTRTMPYDGEAPFPLLVQRVESLISQENQDWSQYVGTRTEQDKQ